MAPDWRNADLDWDSWPVSTYLSENYRTLHRSDSLVLAHHSEFYRSLPAGSLERAVELGCGPNLYPLFLLSGVARRIDAVERSASGLAYLRQQVSRGPDASWLPFWQRCRELNPALPTDASRALGRVRVVEADARSLVGADYDLASMHFVAESITEDVTEFREFCVAFAESVRPGGILVAAFMENMARYTFGDGSSWPGTPIDAASVTEVFGPFTDELRVSRIDQDPDLPAYGYSGMVLMSARRRIEQ